MQAMSKNPRLLLAIQGKKTDRPPFWFMRQAGRYLPEYLKVREETGGFLDLCFSPEKAAEVTLQPLLRFDMDAAILFSDILVVPHALGIAVSFQKGEGPVLEARDRPEKILKLAVTDVVSSLKPVYEAVSLIRSRLDKSKALIGFCGAPWTVATYIVEGGSSRDFAKTRKLAITEPEAFSHLINVLVDASVAHLVAQVKAGADVVQVFDSWASVVPEGEFERWCVEPMKNLVRKFKNQCPGTPIIGFPKAIGYRAETYAQQTGIDVLGLDMSVPLANMQALSKQSAVQGNLDPQLLAFDKNRAVEQTKAILSTMKNRPFIFNLGHGIIPQTPVENVEAVSRTIREWKA